MKKGTTYLTGELYRTFYQHSYLVGSFTDPMDRRHACLRYGDWCWENLRERPLDIFEYLNWFLRRMFEGVPLPSLRADRLKTKDIMDYLNSKKNALSTKKGGVKKE